MDTVNTYYELAWNIWQEKSRREKSIIVGSGIGAWLLCRYVYLKLIRKLRRYPNGPVGVPILNSVSAMADTRTTSNYLASHYGAISMIYAGPQPVVFLNSIDSINKVFAEKASLNRVTDNFNVVGVEQHEKSVGLCQYKYWKSKRQDFQSVITAKLNTEFVNDIHNTSLNEHIFRNVDDCIAANRLWNFHDDTSYLIANLIYYSCFGIALKYQDDTHVQLLEHRNRCVAEIPRSAVLSTLRLGFFLPLFLQKRLFTAYDAFLKYLESAIYKQLNYDEAIWDYRDTKWNEHFLQVQQTKDEQMHPAISLLLAHMRFSDEAKQKRDGSKLAILQQLTAFIFPGIDTTLNTVEYGLVLLAKNPDIQQKIHEELVQIYGDDRMMQKHRFQEVLHSMHYLRAFVMETLRISSVAWQGLPRQTTDEIVVDEYVIPKGSLIFANLKHANVADEYWLQRAKLNEEKTAADVLDVDLWLDEKKQFKATAHRNKMLGFSVGARDCAGKDLAMRSLYLIFAKFVMNYKMSLTEQYRNAKIVQKHNLTLYMDPILPLKMEKRK